MSKKFYKMMLAFKIERNWFFIKRHRKHINRLIDNGEPLCSKRLLSLDYKITQLGNQAFCDQREYENISA